MYLLTEDITLYLTVAGTTAMIQHRHKRYVILSLHHVNLLLWIQVSIGDESKPEVHWHEVKQDFADLSHKTKTCLVC